MTYTGCNALSDMVETELVAQVPQGSGTPINIIDLTGPGPNKARRSRIIGVFPVGSAADNGFESVQVSNELNAGGTALENPVAIVPDITVQGDVQLAIIDLDNHFRYATLDVNTADGIAFVIIERYNRQENVSEVGDNAASLEKNVQKVELRTS